MGFFDLFNNNNNNNQADNNQPYATLVYGSAQIPLTEAEAKGQSVGALFSKFADRLGINTARISKYLYLGKAVDAGALITPQGVYSATHVTESKGC